MFVRSAVPRVIARRALHTSRLFAAQHDTNTYAKDDKVTPPPESSVYRVDSSSESVQSSSEPPDSKWSKDHAYDTLKKEGDPTSYGTGKRARYGGVGDVSQKSEVNKHLKLGEE
ncbi:hypothetical protein DL96DRAFT_1710458 [Flagelloscypha sp. PMI_526]|nr:hypothetical protein DL96DRAFT_1710458 [Flagelloscypha sp. PMI_526]